MTRAIISRYDTRDVVRIARRGQVFSADFAVSLLIFAIASIIAFSLINDLLRENDSSSVEDDARTASALLATTGYPTAWTNSTVLRAGIVSDDQLSMRKARDLSTLSASKLRAVLRISNDAYVYMVNSSNDTVPVFGTCGVGILNVTSTPGGKTLAAASISTGSRPFTSVASFSSLNITNLTPTQAQEGLLGYDVIFLEGNLTASATADQLRSALDDAAQRGITIVVVGYPGANMLGMQYNATNATSIDVQSDAGATFSLSSVDDVDVTSVTMPLGTIETSGTNTASFEVFGLANTGKAAYATWVYKDARVWYFADAGGVFSAGPHTSSMVVAIVANVSSQLVNVSWPTCGTIGTIDANQISVQRRTVAYGGTLLTMHVLVWRGD